MKVNVATRIAKLRRELISLNDREEIETERAAPVARSGTGAIYRLLWWGFDQGIAAIHIGTPVEHATTNGMRRKESRKDRIFGAVIISIWTVAGVLYHAKADDVIPRSAAPRTRVADGNQDLHIAYCGGAESVKVNDATLPRPIGKPELDRSLREARARMNAHIRQTWDYLTTRSNRGQVTEAWKQGQADQHDLYKDQALKECTKRCVTGVAEGTFSLESGMACLAECQEQSALYQKLAQCTKGYTNETEAPVE